MPKEKKENRKYIQTSRLVSVPVGMIPSIEIVKNHFSYGSISQALSKMAKAGFEVYNNDPETFRKMIAS